MFFGASMNSVALVSDGFHNLADAGSFAIALFASVAGSRSGRADRLWEAIGAWVNSALSLTLTFFAGIEAFQRIFIAPHIYEKPQLTNSYFLLAISGILLNGFGAMFLGGHGHSHGGLPCSSSTQPPHQTGSQPHGSGHAHGHSHGHSHGHHEPQLYQGAAREGEGEGLLHSAAHLEDDKNLNVQAL